MRGGVVVVDAWAMLAFLRGEGVAATTVRRFLRQARSGRLRLIMSVINLGEVYYRIAQLENEQKADAAIQLVREMPIQIAAARESIVLAAAKLKARYRLSYADAIAVATARDVGARVITGDPEIMALSPTVVKVARLQR